MLVVEEALEHLKQRCQLIRLLLSLKVLRHLTNHNAKHTTKASGAMYAVSTDACVYFSGSRERRYHRFSRERAPNDKL